MSRRFLFPLSSAYCICLVLFNVSIVIYSITLSTFRDFNKDFHKFHYCLFSFWILPVRITFYVMFNKNYIVTDISWSLWENPSNTFYIYVIFVSNIITIYGHFNSHQLIQKLFPTQVYKQLSFTGKRSRFFTEQKSCHVICSSQFLH